MIRSFLYVAFLLLLMIQPAAAQSTIIPDDIEAYLAEQVQRHNLAGLAAVIVDRDGVIYQGGFGAVTAQSRLPIASLSKAFTATAVMQRVEAGTIDLDAPVQTYLPWFTVADTEASRQITVRHLLHQISGLGEAGYPPPNFPPQTSLESAVRHLSTAEMVAPIGTAYHYFNPNYEILGLIVEQVSGQPFHDYLHDRIFAPLAMSDTTTMPPLTPADLTPGHRTAFGWPVQAAETIYGHSVIPSGGIVATAADLGHFLTMQLNGGRYAGQTIITPASLSQMHTPPSGIDSHYGMGWKTDTLSGVPVIEHGGDLLTYHAQMILLPGQEMGFALLVNQNGFLHNFTSYPALNEGLVALLTGQNPPTTPTMQTVGLVLLALVAVTLSLNAWALVRLWRRRAYWRAVSPGRLALRVAVNLLPLALLLALPYLVWPLLGRFAGYDVLFATLPDALFWLGAVALLGVLKAVLKIGLRLT